MDASLAGARAAVITVSDRCARGERADTTGPMIVRWLATAGAEVTHSTTPDGADPVEHALRGAIDAGARIIVTTGGTGVTPRDATPEGTARVLTFEIPGIAEALRQADAASIPTAVLSRGLAGVVVGKSRAVVINVPGSASAVESGLQVLGPLLPHLLHQLDGGDHS